MIRRCALVPQYEAHEKELDLACRRVLRSGVYVLGPETSAFEEEFAAYIGASCAAGVANGTDAIILALQAFDVGPGDEVILPCFTAIPTLSSVVAAGAIPKFVDVCRDTYLLDIDQVKGALTERTRAVLPVHLFGNVVDIPRLRAVVGDDVVILEDAAQAHGSTLDGRKAGTLGDAAAFSFYPTKNLGAYGDGGAIVTSDAAIDEKVRLLRMYGMVDKDHIAIDGRNSRLDELQAALLRVKLRALDAMNDQRARLAERYRQALDERLFTHQAIPTGVYSNNHVFVSRAPRRRDALISYLSRRDIQTNVYYPLPLHLQDACAHLGGRRGDYPVAEALCDEVIALPMYPEFPVERQDEVIAAINRFAAGEDG